MRVPWIARRSNQSILKVISPEYSLERLMLKLKLQYFGHLMRRTDSLEKALMLRKIESRRRRGQKRMRWLDGITDSMDMNVQLFVTPWMQHARPPCPSPNSWSLLKLMSIESVMPSNHFSLCRPLLLPPSIFPSISVFSNVSSSHQVAKVLEFQHQSFQ